MKAIFLDRDGTINAGIPKYERVDSVDKVETLPFVIEGLHELSKLDFELFIVTNQFGLAEGILTVEDFNKINDKTIELISSSGAKITDTFFCPHGKGSTCECQKPKPGMLLEAAKKYDIDLSESWMIGDRLSDIETGINAGTKTILVQTGSILEADGADFVAANLLEAANYITSLN